MSKILLTWEAGAHLGHEMLVTAAAVLLRKAGHEVVIYARSQGASRTNVQLAGVRWEALPPQESAIDAPALNFDWRSRATSLWSVGFHSAEMIAGQFRQWDAIFHKEQPDVAVLQAAPHAQLAAHMAGIGSVEFGIGFDVPPRARPFPAFRNAESFDDVQGVRFEQLIVGRIAQALKAALPFDSLHELVSGKVRLVTSIPELDHYADHCADHADPSRVFTGPLPLVEAYEAQPSWKRGTPRVLSYVRAAFIDMPKLLHALAALRGDAVVVCTDADEATAALARSLGVRMHLTPVSFAALMPTADLVVSHGGGLSAEALIRGRACLVLPTHYEQFIAASALARRRLGHMLNPRQAEHYRAALQATLADTTVRRNVAALALNRRSMAQRAGQAFVDEVEALIARN
jgi:UDP:flavonoid glycosyltransferase YjiC (YdhE family)